MDNLIKYVKSISTGIFVLYMAFVSSNAYSLDFEDFSLNSITGFLGSLSYSHKGFDIKLTELSIDETFDDNVTYDRKNELEDYITTIGGGFGVTYEGKTKALDLIVKIEGELFAQFNEFNNLTEDLIFNFNNEFSEYDRMSISNIFTHTDAPRFQQDDFFDEQFDRTEEDVSRFDHYMNRFNLDYSKDLAKQFTIITRYRNELDIFEGGANDNDNSFLNGTGFEFDYLPNPYTTFLFAYDFNIRQFENDKSAFINTVSSGMIKYITKKIYFDGRAGLDLIDSFENQRHTRPYIRTSVNYVVDTEMQARFLFENSSRLNSYNEDVFERWRTTASVRRRLSERFLGNISIFYGEGEYIDRQTEPRLLGVRTTFTYDINKNLTGNLTYSFSQNESDRIESEYTKNTLFLGLVAEF
ncbi:MAG: outer membrane beta-barrel protein [Candidatus Brocadiaceae bacterium]|nr:outer membrane beta-barrel protein [Candidatus Brocadiaceae bacterium]